MGQLSSGGNVPAYWEWVGSAILHLTNSKDLYWLQWATHWNGNQSWNPAQRFRSYEKDFVDPYADKKPWKHLRRWLLLWDKITLKLSIFGLGSWYQNSAADLYKKFYFLPHIFHNLLHFSVIGEMNFYIPYFFYVVVRGGSSDVALPKPIKSHPPMHFCSQHIMTNIEFPPFVKKRPLNIFLNDESLDFFTFLPLRLI